MTLPSQLVTVENHTTALTPQQYLKALWGVSYQILYHWNRSGWVKRGLAPPGHLVQLPDGAKPPAGAWNLIILEHTDQQGALGYHDDEQGTGIPYSEVFAADAIADGKTASGVMSHETLEMLADPFVDPGQPRTVTHDGKLWIVEVCDAVENNDYDVGAPDGHMTGVHVSDFCLPPWFGLAEAPYYSFRGSVHRPFTLAPGGYISVAPVNAPGNWTQIYGEHRTEQPAWSSRMRRVHASHRAAIH